MNHVYRLIWNEAQRRYVPAAETARARGKSSAQCGSRGGKISVRVCTVLMIASAGSVYPGVGGASPTGGEVVSGQGTISQSGATTTISQQSRNLSLNWQQFNIASNETVQFVQPSSAAIALNRVIGNDASQIFGRLSANGRVFLVNPNGVLFAPSAQVDVGGLVASTLNISESDFLAGRYQFTSGDAVPGSVVNQGSITASTGGSIALLGGQVSNQGTLRAELGTVALAAGRGVTLDFSGTKLMDVQIDESTLGALAENRQLIQAAGGTVIMTAAARDALLETVVNNTGVIEAHTMQNQGGVIKLLGSFDSGTVNVGGTLDASAPNGGNGGFVETSGAHVKVANSARITTSAPQGSAGTWLIDPSDYTIGAGGDIDGATLSTNLQNGNISIATTQDGNPGNGDIHVNDAVTWSAANTLTLNAIGSVNVNAAITNTDSPVGGSVTLRADSEGACVAGSAACSTVNFSGSGHVTAATVNIHYNPTGSNAPVIANGIGPSYRTPTDYSSFVTGTLAASMLVNDVNQLQALSIASPDNLVLAGRYLLGRDIDASATLNWHGSAGFVPIGGGSLTPSPAPSFTGTFDGAGHTITGLHINRPSAIAVGLFGSVSATGTVRNVSLVPLVDTSGPTPVVRSFIRGRLSVGGLVGLNAGTLINVTVSGRVEAINLNGFVGGLVGQNTGTGTIINGAVVGPSTVTGTNLVGGLVGSNLGSISSSHATASVTGQVHTGGLVGSNEAGASIVSSDADGRVSGTNSVGGLVGTNRGSITGAVANQSFGADGVTAATNAGGLVGTNEAGATIVNSTANGDVEGTDNIGGLVGINRGALTDVHATGQVTGETDAGGLVGSNETGATVEDAFATGAVIGVRVSGNRNGERVGGLVGANTGAINNSYAQGQVAADFNAGGLIGLNSGTVANANASGAVSALQSNGDLFGENLGGLVGYNSATGMISNTHATGQVRGGHRNIGGLVGLNDGGAIDVAYATGTVSGVDGDGDVRGDGVGGLVGTNRVAGVSRGTIRNAHATGQVVGSTFVGGLVGWNDGGIVANAHATGAVGGVNGGGALVSVQVGGLVGFNTATGEIDDTYATGLVRGASETGGLVGRNNGTLSNSYASGQVIGRFLYTAGLVGVNQGAMADSHATGTVVGTDYVGGLVASNTGTISNNSYSTGDVTGTSYIGGLVGANTGAIGDSHATGQVTLELNASGSERNAGGLIGLNSGSVANAYATGAVSGLQSNGDLLGENIGGLIGSNSATGTISNTHATGQVTGWRFVGGLVGLNDGGTVANAYATGSVIGAEDDLLSEGFGGLVGINRAAGTSRGAISNAYATGQVSGAHYVGGLVGLNDGGTIESAHATGDVGTAGVGDVVGGLVGLNTSTGEIDDTYATGHVRGAESTGGLVGSNYGALSNSYAAGQVTGLRFAGGLVADNYGTIENAYATGTVVGTDFVGGLVAFNTGAINGTYSTGHVTGTAAVGGLIGRNWNPDLTSNSFWDTQTSGTTDSDGGIGLQTTQMMSATSLAGLDFTNNWFLIEGGTRPFLRSEYSTTITNAHQLQLVAMDLSASYTLANDIDLSELTNASGLWGSNSGFVPLGERTMPFNGSFNGAGRTLSNLFINRPDSDDVGLFGTVASTVTDLTLVVSSITGRDNVGGLVGYNVGTLSNVSVMTNVAGSGVQVGGLVGYNSGTIDGSTVMGTVGGPVAGALVGYNDGTVINSFYDLYQVSINGFHQLTLGGLYTSQYQDWIDGGRSLDIGDYAGSPGSPGSLAFDGTSYLIGSVQGLKDLLGFADVAGYQFRLTADLDLSSEIGLYIPSFTAARFDGGGHTIANLRLDQSSSELGLFGSVGSDSTITRLFVSDPLVMGYQHVGGLVGRNFGTISDSGVSSSNLGNQSISGGGNVGGLAGTSLGTLSNVYAAVSVDGAALVGGLVGVNSGIIENAYATGVALGDYYVGGLVGVNMGEIRRTYSLGEVNGIVNTGGLIGYNEGSVIDSFWDVESSGQVDQHDGRGTGRSSDEMMQASTFSAWDISVVGGSTAAWRIYDGYTAPLLRSLLTDITLTVDGGSSVYNGSEQTFAVSYDPSGANTALIFTGDATFRNAGTYNLGSQLYSSQRGYNISVAGGSLTINRAALTITSSDVVKTYDGTTMANGQAVVHDSSTLLGTDSLSDDGIFAFDNKNAGLNRVVTVRDVTVNDGNGGNNYIVTYENNTTSTIERANLTLTAGSVTKTYDGTTTAEDGGGATGIEGDIFTTEQSFASKDVLGTGGSTVQISRYAIVDGAGADMSGNYNVSTLTSAGTIERASITLTSSDVSKVYDGTTTADAGVVVAEGRLFGTDTLTGGTFAFADKNAGANKVVTMSGVTIDDGNGGNNYNVTTVTGSGTIERANLTLTSSDVSKVYDGTTTADAEVVVTEGRLFGTDALLGGSFAFGDKNAGTDKVVITSGVTFDDGNAGGNYNITYLNNTTSTIARRELSYVTTAQDRVYDGTTAATVTLSGLTGLVGNESVTASGVGQFNSKDVANANLVTVTSATLSNGANGGLASNYYITAGGTAAARITPASLTVTAEDARRLVGARNPAFNLTYSGLVAGETAANLATLPTASTSADTASLPGSYAIAVSGGFDPNYSFTYVPGTLTVVNTSGVAGLVGTMAYLGRFNNELFLEGLSDGTPLLDPVAPEPEPETHFSGLLRIQDLGIRLPAGVP